MIPVFKPSIRRKDMDGVLTCLISDSIGFGERAREFLSLLSGYTGAEGAFGFRDYSKAVGFALDALGLEEGSRIVISPLSPFFYFDEIVSRGFEVLYADVNAEDGCINPEEIEKLREYDPSAVLLHFPLGYIPDLEQIKTFELPLVLDVSSALGGAYNGAPFSSYGDILILNLEPEGIITAGGGAVVLPAKKGYASRMQKDAKKMPVSSFITDISASLGIIQFNQKEMFLEKREAVQEVFYSSLMKGRHKTLAKTGDNPVIPFSFPVLLEGHVQDVRQYARKKGIMTEMAFEDSSLIRYQIERFPCPRAVSIAKRCMLFPLYPSLSRKNIELISKVLSTLP